MFVSIDTFSDIDVNTLRNELECGVRLPSPIFCPPDVAPILNQCWLNDPYSRPSFKQLKDAIYQNRFYPKDGNGNVAGTEKQALATATIEGKTKYSNVIGDVSMAKQFKKIRQYNLERSYLKMESESKYQSRSGLANSNEQINLSNSTEQSPDDEVIGSRLSPRGGSKEGSLSDNAFFIHQQVSDPDSAFTSAISSERRRSSTTEQTTGDTGIELTDLSLTETGSEKISPKFNFQKEKMRGRMQSLQEVEEGENMSVEQRRTIIYNSM